MSRLARVRLFASHVGPGAYGRNMFTEQEYVQKIEATFNDLAVLGQRLRAPHYSAPGSQLAEDDTDWTPLSISQLAWGCFASAFDHLDLVRLTIEQDRSYTTATYSVLRGAYSAPAKRHGCSVLMTEKPGSNAPGTSATSGTANASSGRRV